MSTVLKVLIVDDSEASAQTLVWMMEMMGYEAITAFNGPSAIKKAKTYQPNVILMDIGLPGMDGYEVCRKLREDEQFDSTIIIAQTGWGDAEHRERSRLVGFDHHLVKPVQVDYLQQLLHSIANNPQRAIA